MNDWEKKDNEQREQDTVEKLRNLTEDVKIPPSLEPERMEEKLASQKRRKRFPRYRAALAAAACLCLVVGAAIGYGAMTGEQDGGGASSGTMTAEHTAGSTAGTAGQIPAAEDYDEIYDAIEASADRAVSDMAEGTVMEESALDTGAAADGASARSVSGGSAEYSDTNVREEGVGEADIVKTDGKNLYIAAGNKVFIVGLGSEKMEEKAVIRQEDSLYISEVYVQDDRLVAVYVKEEYDDGETGYDGYYRQYTCAEVYDVSDPGEPESIGVISQSGYYNTLRVRNGYVYVISEFYPTVGAARSDADLYIPEVQGEKIAAGNIYMPQSRLGDYYTVISAFSLEDPEEKTDSKAVFGSAGMCYVSRESIYVTEPVYEADGSVQDQTSIRKVSYKDGVLEGVAQTKVWGTLNDSFSIDEYEGNLRLVTTVTETEGTGSLFGQNQTQALQTSNSLYVLDEKLEKLGEIHDLAEGESVYSARFMGETGYFVTFRQIDPLFSVDLSDPKAPEIIGKLKIPGFSEYLHPYGDGKLLGIGMDVDEEGVTTSGVKLSMFDISDPADVKETDKYTISDMFGTSAAYNYRAVFADVEKNLFGFTAYDDQQYYYLFTYEEGTGFKEVFCRELSGYEETRGLYVGDTFYLVNGYTVESYDMSDFTKLDDIVL